MLVVLSQPTFAQHSEDYVDIPSFNVGMDATYKDCEALQQRASARSGGFLGRIVAFGKLRDDPAMTIRRCAQPAIRRWSFLSVVSRYSRRSVPDPGSGPTGKKTGVSFRSVALPTVSAVS